jgi:hypothetical protein
MLLRVEECLIGVEEQVTNDMNAQLLQTFTVEEIATALAQMQPRKFSGTDGFEAAFIKNYGVLSVVRYVKLF